MTQSDAVKALLEAADHDCVIAVDLVARALEISGRLVLRDWRTRQLCEIRIGRHVRLPARLARETYFGYISGR